MAPITRLQSINPNPIIALPPALPAASGALSSLPPAPMAPLTVATVSAIGVVPPAPVGARAAGFRASSSPPLSLVPTRIDFDSAVGPDDSYKWKFTRQLLATGDHYLLSTPKGPVQLVVQKNYLDPVTLEQVAADISRARAEIPNAYYGHFAKKVGLMTVYLHDGTGPISNALAAGPHVGETALELAFVQEDREPLFHEFTHIFEPDSNVSESLSEGFAEYVQRRMRPNHQFSYPPEVADSDRAAADALAKFPELLPAIGSASFVTFRGPRAAGQGTPVSVRSGVRRFYADDARPGFYYASRSFVQFLVDDNGGLEKFLSVQEKGGAPDSYQRAYGKSLAELQTAWLKKIAH